MTTDHPCTDRVRDIEHCWIPMPDGTRLAARIWLPETDHPVPALLEYIPYRKRDMVRARDERNHPWFAAHGYGCLRVDMRGSGDSEGIMPDMYSPDELADARHVIEWIAAQPWCSGRVGMFGTSWGGTASLQAAIDAPEPLKAVIANCATIDRFEDDIHWMGGCILTDSLEWGATLPAILAAPPDAATVGPGWMEMWTERLDALNFPHETWLREATRAPYWQNGSVIDQVDRLTCPVLTVGGWADRYSNSVMRLVEARPDLCRGIVGPWGHHYPDHGEPGPAMHFQAVALDWWDTWLKSDYPSMPNGPRLRLWRREFDPPQDRLAQRSGSWIALSDVTKPTPGVFHLGDGALTPTRSEDDISLVVPFDLLHGSCAGDTGYFGRVGGLPLDQAPDDARALCFDSPVLADNLDLIGHANLSLNLSGLGPEAQIAARICEVTPEGRSHLVTRTVMAMPEGETDRSSVTLCFPTTAYRFSPGNRIRLAIGSSYWPLVWPPLCATGWSVNPAGSSLEMPRRPDATEIDCQSMPPVDEVERPQTCRVRSEGDLERTSMTDIEGRVQAGWRQPAQTLSFNQIDLDFTYETSAKYIVDANDPAQTQCRIQHRIEIRRPDGMAQVASALEMTAEEKGFSTAATLTVSWNETTLIDRTSHFRLER